MLITKTNPVGLDFYIQKLQTRLHTILLDADHWNLADPTKYKAYGRCHRNKTTDGYIAENYEGGNEYKEVFWDDTLIALSFFGIGNSGIKAGTINSEADIHFVMFANLSKLALKDDDNNTIAHRADEEIRKMITDIIGKHSFGFTYVSTELWVENVLREYSGSRRDQRLKFLDMHPVHCFRINLKLVYNPKKIC